MNTFQLSCFLAVAETLNFARAAEILHVTQPAVTQQIHSLEKELNVTLFQRTTRSVKITPEGLFFLNDAQHIMVLADRAKRRFQNPQERKFQLFSLGFGTNSLLPRFIPTLKALREQFPNLHPRIQTAPGPHLHRMLEDGDLDAIVDFLVPSSKKTALHYREICQVSLVCLLPQDHPLAMKETLVPEDLQQEHLVLFDPAKPQPNALRPSTQLLGEHTPAELYFCETAEAMITLVLAGYGAAVLPDLFLPGELPLAQIPLQGSDTVSLGVYYRTLQGNAPLKAMVQLLKSFSIHG